MTWMMMIASALAGGWIQMGVGYTPEGTNEIAADIAGEQVSAEIISQAGSLDLGAGVAVRMGAIRLEVGAEARMEAIHADEVMLDSFTIPETAIPEVPLSLIPRPAFGPTIGLSTRAGPISLGIRGTYLIAPTVILGASRGGAGEFWVGAGGTASITPFARVQVLDHEFKQGVVDVKARSFSSSFGVRLRIAGNRARKVSAEGTVEA